MRWDNLFDDLESQLEYEITVEDVTLQAEEERLRLSRLGMRDRIVAAQQAPQRGSARAVRLMLTGGAVIDDKPVLFGKDWLSADLVSDSIKRQQCVVPLAAISALVLEREDIPRSLNLAAPEPETGRLADRLGLAFVLRDLCRRRRPVEILTGSGAHHGTIDRVGRDHLDLAVHEQGTLRRESAVTQYRIIPFPQIQLVRL
ncbi:MAG: hypothetical protein JWP30_1303 [Homoserinimonas sp.]|nr:hypothetical protein [Homoserinimonas sp.]